MKKLYFIIIVLIINGSVNAQNLVPNPSFEDYLDCPSELGELYKCVSWSSFGNTPDYYNACSEGTIAGVPTNSNGFQYAATGNAYCGFIQELWGPGAMIMGYIGAKLTEPLVKGEKYYASFKISFSDNSDCPTNKVGMRLSTIPFDSLHHPQLDNIAAVFTDSVFTDKTKWHQIKGSFIADSNYTYIIIGNFFNDLVYCMAGFSYFYVDDICLSTDSLNCYSSVGIKEIKDEKMIDIYPNPAKTYLNISSSGSQLSGFKDKYILTIRNTVGDVHLSENIEFINNYKLDLEMLTIGLYFLSLQNDKVNYVRKLVIQK